MPLRSALLAGLAFPTIAFAQGTVAGAPATATLAPPEAATPFLAAPPSAAPVTGEKSTLLDGSGDIAKPGDVIDFAADTMEYSDDEQLVTATGHVQINRDQYRLSADSVTYNRTSGQVEARGNVATIDPEGNKAYGDRVILTDSLKDGAINNILLVLADGGRLAAVSGVRVNGRSILNRAIYSPCAVEKSDGCPKTPVWAIKAVKIVHDPVKHRISYQKARVEILGVPIIYLPAFSHPDGSTGRASGVLLPEFEIRNTLGFGIGIPYHLDLGPDRDVTIKPWLFSGAKPAIDVRGRQLFAAGPVQFRAYLTRGDVIDFAPDGVTEVDKGQRWRGYFEANGRLQLSDEWRATFSTRLSSDDTFDRRYNIDYDDSLRSTVDFERFRSDSYLSVAGWGFQNLRANKGPDTTPIVLPLIDYDWRPEEKILGGQLDIAANSMSLVRIDGQGVQRALASAKWTRSVLTSFGVRLTGTGFVRGDLYNTENAAEATLPTYAGKPGFETRGIAVGAVDAEWPFAGPLLGGTQTITPRVQVSVAPLHLNRNIPNEDARSIDLEDTNLFDLNRASGYDRFESGSRVTYGLQYGFTRPRLAITSEIGESVRISGTGATAFLQGTGLSGQFSDIVGRTTLQYGSYFSLTHRFRVDSTDGVFRRNEIDVSAGTSQTYITVGYANYNRNITLEDLTDLQEVRAGARVAFSRYWSAFGSVIIDLTTKSQEPTSTTDGFTPVRHRVGVQYEDSCFRFGLTWRRDYITDRDFRAGNSYIFSIAFKNLGR
ncbi:LPS assembly protein LptD [Polymorphobacter sp. PAMC 29334]|uniref:LPS-assembly protein LptD n=1 Tax=Polymorphobacter sp. PAMC 29334 TaxID=2862331 RepID=UPI001C7685D5|nr:LPS assembly protein LptD [Polymorphobacter sp. PAMC 29334]QYE34310.1 LPS assembly protein LptD [Polymorphobacter sp. PAMC 29334]